MSYEIKITGEGEAIEIAEALRDLADTISGHAAEGTEENLHDGNFEDHVLMTEIKLK